MTQPSTDVTTPDSLPEAGDKFPTPAAWLRLACPRCGTTLGDAEQDAVTCEVDGVDFVRIGGVWRLLSPEREQRFDQFVQEYETVRRAEGRGSEEPAYHRALPDHDLTGRFSEDWAIRARSFHTLIERVIEPLEARHLRPLRILDLGAGNGWLSNRVALRGHQVAAVDLLTNDQDGLGAHVHFDSAFVPIQAEFDHLPVASGQFDLAIFNSSLHYSTHLETTLSEAMRTLTPGGKVVVIDSPIYRDPDSGRQMVREREREFERRYGFRSNSLPSENFLTHLRLDEIDAALGLRWSKIRVHYGWRWRLRPWAARIRGRREPASFMILVGERAVGPAPVGTVERFVRALSRRALDVIHAPTRRRLRRSAVIETHGGRSLVVLPDVFNPVVLRSGAFLADVVDRGPIPRNATVLDMGTGSGIGAIAAARRASAVVAVDINPSAVRCARANAVINGVDAIVDVRHGDLFEPVSGERFDVVLFNPPYYRGTPSDDLDRAWRAESVIDRFAIGLPAHLNDHGFALLALSTDGEPFAFLDALRKQELRIHIAARRSFPNETMTIYRVERDRRTAHADSV